MTGSGERQPGGSLLPSVAGKSQLEKRTLAMALPRQPGLSNPNRQLTYGPPAEAGLAAKRPRGSLLDLTLMSDSGQRGEGRADGGSPPLTGPVTCIIRGNEPDRGAG